ncbi:MAG: pteridine reductase [Proteobacteria bacterium]|nr:MAG: pteridine reductase [Pseudomonadota bacterium]QKK10442.1 MAG: pteridine reductase [Pseudomonadota bacterium]
MDDSTVKLNGRVALITGAAHRIGAAIARRLHDCEMNLVLHYRSSHTEAAALREELLARRAESVHLIQADLLDTGSLGAIVEEARGAWNRLDALVNNASSFYPTPVGQVTLEQWEDLLGTNLRAPFFLSQAAARWLRGEGGVIVNIVDIHADRPLKEHPTYSIAKAGLVMLTKALARELGPTIRVNAVAPGVILWPERGTSEEERRKIISSTLLQRQGTPDDIARAVLFLIRDADYMSGQVLTVDGGRTIVL